MSSPAAFRGRLPGVTCAPRPSEPEVTTRLDITGFVGYAERGPLDVPVLVTSTAEYRDRFGGDVALAVDERGSRQFASMPPAVEMFFANGGRRAWIVRVADGAAEQPVLAVRLARTIPLSTTVALRGVVVDDGTPPRFGVEAGWSVVAATPGGWSRGITVDVVPRALLLDVHPTADGRWAAAAPQGERLEPEDHLLIEHADGTWTTRWDRATGLAEGDVVRRIRMQLEVRRGDDVLARTPELRLGRGGRDASTPSWHDVLQPGDGFDPDRSMWLRVHRGTLTTDRLGVVLGRLVPPSPLDELEPETTAAATAAVREPWTMDALRAEGLTSHDPTRFVDRELRGATTDVLRTEIERAQLGLRTPLRGLHALAAIDEVSLLTLPDLYHRPWHAEDLAEPAAEPPPEPQPAAPIIGFTRCAPDGATLDLTDPIDPTEPANRTPSATVVRRPVSDPYEPAQLAAVGAVLADAAMLGAARRDVVTVAALPRTAGDRQVRELVEQLTVSFSGTDAAGFVGLWHPWVAVPERRSDARSPLRWLPADGAVAGVIARRERAHGVWVEPAGLPLDGAVGADPIVAATALRVFELGANVVSRTPRGIVTSSAHSLSHERDALQLSVRRLIIWVRRLAEREGARLAFEPDSERLRSQTVTLFGHHLEQLRQRGALIAYAVDVEPSPPVGAEEGRLRIDLQLAPTSPIEFITVSLVRSGTEPFAVVGG